LAQESKQLAEEKIRHAETQAQLSKGTSSTRRVLFTSLIALSPVAQDNLSQILKEARQSREKISELETERATQLKSSQQLKDAIKESKLQNEMLQKKLAEERQLLTEKRCGFSNARVANLT